MERQGPLRAMEKVPAATPVVPTGERGAQYLSGKRMEKGWKMIELWWIYGGFMVGLWWIYGGFMVDLWWIYGGFMVLIYDVVLVKPKKSMPFARSPSHHHVYRWDFNIFQPSPVMVGLTLGLPHDFHITSCHNLTQSTKSSKLYQVLSELCCWFSFTFPTGATYPS